MENGLRAVRLAIACGADAVEIDVRATRDGVPVVLHDATLERTTEASGPLSAWSYRELRHGVRLQGGRDEPVPTLREVLAATYGRLPLAIEIKEPDVTAATLAEVERAGASDWVAIWSFHGAAVQQVRERAPSLSTAFLCLRRSEHAAGWNARDFLDQAAGLGVTGVSLFPEDVDADVVDDAHRRGLAVYSGTVNGAELTARLAGFGLDALITDDPLASFEHLTRLEEDSVAAV
jgi:glycerophosphoryl diester phosphodiesterase